MMVKSGRKTGKNRTKGVEIENFRFTNLSEAYFSQLFSMWNYFHLSVCVLSAKTKHLPSAFLHKTLYLERGSGLRDGGIGLISGGI